MLGSLDSDLPKLFETGEFCLETLKKLKTSKSRISHKPGTYIYLIYSPDNHDVIGVYVGSAEWLSSQIKEHKKDLETIYRRPQACKLPRKTKPRRPHDISKVLSQKGLSNFGFASQNLTLLEVRKIGPRWT